MNASPIFMDSIPTNMYQTPAEPNAMRRADWIALREGTQILAWGRFWGNGHGDCWPTQILHMFVLSCCPKYVFQIWLLVARKTHASRKRLVELIKLATRRIFREESTVLHLGGRNVPLDQMDLRWGFGFEGDWETGEPFHPAGGKTRLEASAKDIPQ